jgi:L-threonylcarbamoyladenylate synthase
LPDSSNIVQVDPAWITPETILTAGKVLSRSGVVIFPAKCLYGVAVNALDHTAVQKVFHLKQRPPSNPLLILVKDLQMLHTLVVEFPPSADRLIKAFWPGNLTLIFKARPHLPASLTAKTGKIGIRIPSHPVARALVNAVHFPITGTSANRSGRDGCTRISRLDPSIVEQADLILDSGMLKGGKGSTIADVSQKTVHIYREGEISAKKIKAALA